MSWEQQLAGRMKMITQRHNKLYRALAFKVFGEIMQRTPVDTGRLRQNWQIATDSPPEGTIPGEDTSGQQATGKALRVIEGADTENEIWIANNLPYAYTIEMGRREEDGKMRGSIQAPAGMVRITAARYEAILREAGNELDK
jgi:hypothetical protein